MLEDTPIYRSFHSAGMELLTKVEKEVADRDADDCRWGGRGVSDAIVLRQNELAAFTSTEGNRREDLVCCAKRPMHLMLAEDFFAKHEKPSGTAQKGDYVVGCYLQPLQ